MVNSDQSQEVHQKQLFNSMFPQMSSNTGPHQDQHKVILQEGLVVVRRSGIVGGKMVVVNLFWKVPTMIAWWCYCILFIVVDRRSRVFFHCIAFPNKILFTWFGNVAYVHGEEKNRLLFSSLNHRELGLQSFSLKLSVGWEKESILALRRSHISFLGPFVIVSEKALKTCMCLFKYFKFYGFSKIHLCLFNKMRLLGPSVWMWPNCKGCLPTL